MKKQIELLAPAGSLTALKAAVENGANAVYIGGSQFSARKKAENFTEEQMIEGIQYAHERGAAVHVALNTLLSNEEIGEVLPYLYTLAELQVDAVIVQDLGVAQLIRETLPQLPLHASTQMAVHNVAGVQWLEANGFSRAVLARETSLETIREIRQKTSLELEVFVHGALCVAYSGQCLLSSMIGGRSGNRGLCAQPCRMRYQLMDTEGRIYKDPEGSYLLSTRDLNMLDSLPVLLSSGVASLKIEGRMKRPEYVATVVHHYRQAIDAYETHTSYDEKTAQRELLQIFNRKFTTGYFFGNPGADLMSHQRPDNRGVLVADVMKTERKNVWMQLRENVSVGDGYALWNAKGEEIAGVIRELSIKGKSIVQGNRGQIVLLRVSGDAHGAKEVYRTADANLLKQAEQSYSRPSQPKNHLVSFQIELREGKPMSLFAWDEAGHQQHAVSTYLVEKARQRPSDADSIRKQLDRLGNTTFTLKEVLLDMEEGLIAPASELNSLRRQVIEGLEQQLLEEQQQQRGKELLESYEDYTEDVGDLLDRIPPQVMAYGLQTALSVTVSSEEALDAAIANGADLIYLQTTALRRQTPILPKQYVSLAERCHAEAVRIYWTCSPFQNEVQMKETCALMSAAQEAGFDGVLVGNLGLLQVAKEMGWQNIAVDYPMNIFNDVTLQALSEQEICRATLSPELQLEQSKGFSYLGNLPIELIVHGNFPLMISEQCVVGSVCGGRTASKACSQPCLQKQYQLEDRTGAKFPLQMDVRCRMHVYNSKTLNLYKRLETCLETGVDFLRIEGRERSAQWIGTVVKVYKQAIEQYNQNGTVEPDSIALDTLEQLAPEGSTYGHYFRGVL